LLKRSIGPGPVRCPSDCNATLLWAQEFNFAFLDNSFNNHSTFLLFKYIFRAPRCWLIIKFLRKDELNR